MDFISEIRKIAENIRFAEANRKKLAEFLRSVNGQINLIQKSGPIDLGKIKIAGVDGGIVKKSLHGFDLILARAAGVCFSFDNNKVASASYYPAKVPSPIPYTLESVTDMDFAYFASIIRQSLEVATARKCIEKFQPDILLMDGSIVPHYTTKPANVSAAFANYEELMANYQKLYKEARQAGVILAGVVEDSRSDRLAGLIKNDLLAKLDHAVIPKVITTLDKSRDTNLLYWTLERNERTYTFDYTTDLADHPILKDFEQKTFFSFYLKTAKWDRPVRVDFMEKEQADKLASVLLTISGQHSRYGFPSVLIEADNVAKLSEQELDNFYSYILKYAGNMPSIMKLRREQRPF